MIKLDSTEIPKVPSPTEVVMKAAEQSAQSTFSTKPSEINLAQSQVNNAEPGTVSVTNASTNLEELKPVATVRETASPVSAEGATSSQYKEEGSKFKDLADGTFKISLSLNDILSNVTISDSLIVKESSLETAYDKAVKEVKSTLETRSEVDIVSKEILDNLNSGKIAIPNLLDLKIQPRPAPFEEIPGSIKPASTALTESAKLASTGLIEQVKPALSGVATSQARVSETTPEIEKIKVELATKLIKPAATASITATAESEKSGTASSVNIGETSPASVLQAISTGSAQTSDSGKTSSAEVDDLSMFKSLSGILEPTLLKSENIQRPSLETKSEARVETSSPIAKKSVLNEIVNPPNPIVPALTGLGQTITETSSTMTDTLAGKMESTFNSSTMKGGTTQTLSNNVTNITNSQQPGSSEFVGPPTPKVESPSQEQGGKGGGMSDYYLRAIYEALVVQGVKLRTI
jgi:hypothetical protein